MHCTAVECLEGYSIQCDNGAPFEILSNVGGG